MTRIPVTLVTGFLGSGKTTLIARLLTRPGFAGTLVVVNEFGEVGIDHDLLEASSDDTILLANGCLCCTIRGNLVDTLLDVQAQVAERRLRGFDRVVVETSGVADPAMLLGFLLGEAAVMARYRLDGVVTTVDALAGGATLARHEEAATQVRVADRLLLTKTDLAAPDAIAALTARLRALNPSAPLIATVRGDIDAASLLGIAAAERVAAASCGDAHDAHDHGGHADRFHASVLAATRAVSRDEVAALEGAVRAHAGSHLLRLKAILPLQGGGAAVLHAAPSVVHPAEYASGEHGAGRLVLITDGPAPAALVQALTVFGLAATGPGQSAAAARRACE